MQQNAPPLDWSGEIGEAIPLAEGYPQPLSCPLSRPPQELPPMQSLVPAPVPQLHMSSAPTAQAAVQSAEEQRIGSLRALLSKNVGNYVVATFLLGTENPISWEGVLHSVGNDYLVIYQPDQGRYITGDFYSLKFVEFYETPPTPQTHSCPGYRRRDGHAGW